jgi:Flp pilus assembly protein TadB
MSTELILLVLVVLVIVAVAAIIIVGRRRRGAANKYQTEVAVEGVASKMKILKLKNQAARMPAPGLVVELVKRGPLPRLLEQADVSREVSVEDVARMKVLLMLIFGGLGALLGGLLFNPLLILLFGVVGLAMGFRGPDGTIRQGAELRQNKLSRALPLALEVIGLAVERTSIDAGIAYYCQYFKQEVLAEELSYVVERVQQLKERLDVAMTELLRKNRNDDLSFLVAAVGQAQQVGGRDLKDMLAGQARELRIKREQDVKGRSLRAPVLMTFPTMINMLALLIILGVLAFLQVASGGK